jgi:hypothetical protein
MLVGRAAFFGNKIPYYRVGFRRLTCCNCEVITYVELQFVNVASAEEVIAMIWKA